MGKSTHFSGQPLYGQVIKLLDKSKILQISQENGGERYTKRFNIWVHLVVMHAWESKLHIMDSTTICHTLMHYIDLFKYLENPEQTWRDIAKVHARQFGQLELFVT